MKPTHNIILTVIIVVISICSAFSQSCSECRFISPVFDSVTVSTVKFGEGKNVDGNNQELYMDIYQPFGDTMTNRPVAIFAFGGAFVQGARDDWYVVEVCKLLAKAGYVAVSPDYRYGIDYSEIIQLRYMRIFFRPVQDMRACIQYLKADYSELGNNYDIDTSKIILGGASAGAISALMTSYCDKPSEMLQSGSPTALDALGGFYSTTGLYPNYGWGHAAVLNIAGALLDADWIEPGDVPHIAAHGDSDQVVPYGIGSFGPLTAGLFNLEGSSVIDSMAKAKGVCSYLFNMEGKDHPSEDLGMPYIMSVVSRLMLRMHAVINNRSFCCPLNIETDPADTARYNAAFPEVTMNAQITNDNGNAQMRWCSFPCNTTSTASSISFTPDTNWQFMTSYVYEGNCQDVGFTILKSDSLFSSVKLFKETANNLFAIYPHPISGNFVIALKNNTAEKIKVEIIDFAGRIVYTIETVPDNNNIYVNAENLLSGSYVLKLSSEKELWQPRKLIVAE